MKTRRKPGPRTIGCSHCKGLGTVLLAKVYLETLDLLARQREPISGSDLARLAGVGVPAMCNRLVRLDAYGLAEGQRNGNERLWSATEKEDR